LVDGASGTGKSTFLNLLMGFLIPNSGNIYYDGVAINNDIKSYQNCISYIPQEISMLNGTLYENVIFDYKSIDRDDIHFINCCKQANIDWINNIFCEKIINHISIGQKQRIGIARALYKNNDILIMDEPTSALDYANSKLILESIIESYRNKIIIYITHDVELKKYATKILKLNINCM
jgi:ABC-type bacteriocin/lantibiotic exporter with double-glycine peptidase domain